MQFLVGYHSTSAIEYSAVQVRTREQENRKRFCSELPCDGGFDRFNDSGPRRKMYTSLLQQCVKMESLEEGKKVHAHVIKSGIEPDMFMWNTLVNMYAKCGSIEDARQVFDKMFERDVVSWNAMIAGCSQQGHAVESLRLFSEMLTTGLRPNQFLLASVLRGCASLLALDFGRQVHACIVKNGFMCDVFVGSALVDLYAKCGVMDNADQVFDEMPEVNEVSWNAMIAGYVQNGLGQEAIRLFHQMRSTEPKLSKFALSSILRACASLEAIEDGTQLHSIAIKIGCELDPFLGSCLIDMYAKCGIVEDARKVFNRMSERDVVSWTSMISGYDQHGYGEEAMDLFLQMKWANVKPNQFTFASVLSASGNIAALEQGKKFHANVIKTGHDLDVTVGNAVVAMYAKCGSMEDAHRMFCKMHKRDILSWNTMAAAFSQREEGEEALKFFRHMRWAGIEPNKFTFVSILRGCASHLGLQYGQQVHAHVIKTGFESDVFVASAFVDVYAKYGCIESACQAFEKMPEPDLVSWTMIIAGYAQHALGEKSLRYFYQMQSAGVRANEFTFASALKACTGITAIEQGKQIHVLIIKTQYEAGVFVASALVDMYAKCGGIEDAIKMFEKMPERDLVSWNTMIVGYAQHGCGKEALQLFEEMQEAGMRPDHITFVGVLSACSHVGLVDEGCRYFGSLSEEYGITPTMEHYACMVDLFGRAGQLDEVEDFINKMPVEPDALIWQTLLSACRIHGNIKLGKHAADRIFDLQPENDSTYVLLSNLYAAAGRWNDVANVRKQMADRGVKKEPGCSWIEIKNSVHVFLSEDTSHPQVNEI
jgi:pentatricopeptide repeat protein